MMPFRSNSGHVDLNGQVRNRDIYGKHLAELPAAPQ